MKTKENLVKSLYGCPLTGRVYPVLLKDPPQTVPDGATPGVSGRGDQGGVHHCNDRGKTPSTCSERGLGNFTMYKIF